MRRLALLAALIVVDRKVGGEPVRYVSNIVKYYVAYGLFLDEDAPS